VEWHNWTAAFRVLILSHAARYPARSRVDFACNRRANHKRKRDKTWRSRVLDNNTERAVWETWPEILRGWLGRTQRSEATGSYAIVKSIEFRHSPIHRAPSVFSERPAAGYAPLARRGTSENTERFTCH